MANPNLKENKFKRMLVLPFRGIIKKMMPLTYIKLQYRYITHHKLNIKNPTRYTEKLQYLRYFVYPKDKEVSRCAGRVTVRDFIKEKGLKIELIALELNGEIIPKSEFENLILKENDKAEIVSFVGGG